MVPDGSVVDLVCALARSTSREEINAAFAAAAAGPPLEGILAYSDAPLVPTDILRSPYSCVFDSQMTMASERLAKVFGWYDDEWGYSSRLVDLAGRL